MALTRKEYIASGATLVNVNFTLGYIDKDYIYVYVDGKEYTDQLSYTWRNDNQIELLDQLEIGTKYYVRRVIPRDNLVNDYENGAILREGNLNDSYLQTLMILEEIQDGFITIDDEFLIFAKLVLNDNLDLNDFKVINLGEPTEPNDAVTKSYADVIKDDLHELDNNVIDLSQEVAEINSIIELQADGVLTNVESEVGSMKFTRTRGGEELPKIEVPLIAANTSTENGGTIQDFIDSNPVTIPTVASMPSLSGSVVDGQIVEWNCYRNIFDGGNNKGVIKTGAHTADGGRVFSIDGSTYIEADFSGGVLPIRKFGAYCDGINDDTLAIQNAAYALGSLFNPVKKLLIQGTPRISKGILLYARDGCSIEGESGKVGTFIRMDQNMTVALDSDFQALQDQGTFDYTYPAAFVISAARRLGKADWDVVNTNTAQWAITFRNLGFTQDFERRQAAAIHAPRIGNSKFDNMLFKGVQSGLRSQDIYTTSMDACFFTKVVTPVDHYSTGTFTATGTSFHITATGVSDCNYGWKFNKLFYSSMTCCACDGWARYQPDGDFVPSSYAYDLNGCSGMVLTACGAEDTAPTKMKGLFKFTGGATSSVIVDGGAYVIVDTPSTTNIALCTFDSQSVTLRSPTLLLNKAGGKVPYCEVLSGDVIVETLNQAIDWRRLFNFANATNTSRLIGNDMLQLPWIEASLSTSTPFGSNATSNVEFGINDNPYPNGWDTWDNATFTAPYAGVWTYAVTVHTEGAGLNYLAIKKSVGDALAIAYDINDVSRKTYSVQKTFYLKKGETLSTLLRTATGATGSILHSDVSITQAR